MARLGVTPLLPVPGLVEEPGKSASAFLIMLNKLISVVSPLFKKLLELDDSTLGFGFAPSPTVSASSEEAGDVGKIVDTALVTLVAVAVSP